MSFTCPGAANIKGTPTLELKTCPECAGEIEMFSTDIQAACPCCGFEAYNDAQSCIQWCRYARECVGDELGGFQLSKRSGITGNADQVWARMEEQLREPINDHTSSIRTD